VNRFGDLGSAGFALTDEELWTLVGKSGERDSDAA